jgi:hypothetical protein
MKLLLVTFSFALSLALNCPRWSCKSLTPNTCAIRKEGEILVNEDGCWEGYQCNLQVAGFFFSSPSSADSFSCYLKGEVDKSQLIYPSYYEWKNSPECKYDSGMNLASGSHPKQCEVDEDCELVNGELSKCECASDGKSYCKPSLNSDYFDYWYEICDNGYADDKLYNQLYKDYLYTPLLEFSELDDQDCLERVITQQAPKPVSTSTSNSYYLIISGVAIFLVFI